MKLLRGCCPLFFLAAAASCSSKSDSNASGSPDGSTAARAPSGRTVPTCAQINADLVPTLGMSDPGWSIIPTALQKLPPGATFCGTVVSGVDAANGTAIANLITDLSGQDLLSFYTPLMVQAGCTLMQQLDSVGGDQAAVFTCTSRAGGTVGASGTWTFVQLTYNQ